MHCSRLSRLFVTGLPLLAACSGSSLKTSPDGGRDSYAALPGDGPADQQNACYWQRSGGRYALAHFVFLLTTPDGQAQVPPQTFTFPGQDAGAA